MMYCVKCRAKKEGVNHQEIVMKNGKHAIKAFCESCGTTMFKMGDIWEEVTSSWIGTMRITMKHNTIPWLVGSEAEDLIGRLSRHIWKNISTNGDLLVS